MINLRFLNLCVFVLQRIRNINNVMFKLLSIIVIYNENILFQVNMEAMQQYESNRFASRSSLPETRFRKSTEDDCTLHFEIMLIIL